jgi:hypothetical protein
MSNCYYVLSESSDMVSSTTVKRWTFVNLISYNAFDFDHSRSKSYLDIFISYLNGYFLIFHSRAHRDGKYDLLIRTLRIKERKKLVSIHIYAMFRTLSINTTLNIVILRSNLLKIKKCV